MSKPSAASDARPRALMIAPEAPYPLHGGGALRTASLLHYLAGRYTVDVVLFREPSQDPGRHLPPGLADRVLVIDLPVNARHLPAKLMRNTSRLLRSVPPLIDRFSGFAPQVARFLDGRRYDVGVIEHFWCASYCAELRKVCRTTMLNVHNVESVLHRRCAATDNWPANFAHRRFATVCEALERRWLPQFDRLLTVSDPDAELLRTLAPAVPISVYPNAIPWVPLPVRPEENVIAFSANFGYHPNITAVRYFVEEIWPTLRKRHPDLRWRLIGRNEECVRSLVDDDPRIELIGPVEDAVWQLSSAKAVVVPLLAGSGTRLKILEAWAAGRPVISTSVGAEGLPVRDGENILLADSPAAFVRAVESALQTPDSTLGSAGRALYERCYTWPAAWTCLDNEQSFL